jgi:hypothetical protein
MAHLVGAAALLTDEWIAQNCGGDAGCVANREQERQAYQEAATQISRNLTDLQAPLLQRVIAAGEAAQIEATPSEWDRALRTFQAGASSDDPLVNFISRTPSLLIPAVSVRGINATDTDGGGSGRGQPGTGAGTSARQGAPNEGALLWGSWNDYPKITVEGREYAQIGDRMYTRHAVDRLLPSSLGTPVGANGPGRNVTPNMVEEVISGGSVTTVTANGVPRTIYTSGNVSVVTENEGRTIITILRNSSP